MFDDLATIDLSPAGTMAADLFLKLGVPALVPFVAIVLFAGLLFTIVAAIKSFIT